MRAHRTSGRIAKDRLEHMLILDKTQLQADASDQMKRELRSVIRKYINTEHMVRMDVEIRLISETKQGEAHVKAIQVKGL